MASVIKNGSELQNGGIIAASGAQKEETKQSRSK